MPRGEALKPYQIKGRGLGTKEDTPPLCVKVKPEISAAIRALPNRSEWLRRVITRAAQQELLNSDW